MAAPPPHPTFFESISADPTFHTRQFTYGIILRIAEDDIAHANVSSIHYWVFCIVWSGLLAVTVPSWVVWVCYVCVEVLARLVSTELV